MLTIANGMSSNRIDDRKSSEIFTYISDLPDFSHNFNASDLLVDAILANSTIYCATKLFCKSF